MPAIGTAGRIEVDYDKRVLHLAGDPGGNARPVCIHCGTPISGRLPEGEFWVANDAGYGMAEIYGYIPCLKAKKAAGATPTA